MSEYLIDSEKFKKFVVENKLVSYAASWVVAVTATVLVQSFVGDIVLPTLYIAISCTFSFFGFKLGKNFDFLNAFEKVKKINVSNFLKELISFIIMLFLLYYSITYFLNNLVDADGKYMEKGSQQNGEAETRQPKTKPT